MECVIAPGADALLCINWLGDSRVTLTGERDSSGQFELRNLAFKKLTQFINLSYFNSIP